MQNSEENRLRRGQDVHAYLTLNEDVVATNARLVRAKEDLKAYCDTLTSIGVLQAEGSEPHTGHKQDERFNLTIEVLGICSCMSEAGTKTYRSELTKMGAKIYGHFERMTEEKFVHACEAIVKHAEKVEFDLYDFGLEPGMIDSAKIKLQDYSDAMAEPRTYVSTRKAGTRSVPSILKAIDALLKYRMDGLVLSFQRTHPEFVLGYFAVRQIMDLGVRHPGRRTEETDSAPPDGVV